MTSVGVYSILIPPNISPPSKRQNIYPTRDDKTDVNDYEKKGEDSEVNVLHCSPQLPMDKLVVTSPHWRSSRIIALCNNDALYCSALFCYHQVHLISAPQHPAISSPADCLLSPGQDQREPRRLAGAGDCPTTPAWSSHSSSSSDQIETSSTMEWLSITHFRVMILCTDCSISNQMKSTGATVLYYR